MSKPKALKLNIEDELLKLDQAIARSSFPEFVKLVRPEFGDPVWFHAFIMDRLQDLSMSDADGMTRLGMALPPGHAKSEYALLYCAWLVGCDPNMRIMYVTYQSDFACKQLERLKEIVKLPAYVRLFGPRINDKRVVSDHKRGKANNKREFGIIGGSGSVMACGFDGGITGGRADLVVIDDPFKGHEDASSKTIREKRWQSYQSEVLTRFRVGRPFRVLMLFTRWHLDDLTGRCRELEPDDWTWIEISALRDGANDNEELEAVDPRDEGEALWPAAISAPLLFKRREVAPEVFACVYQQKPVPDGGAIFKKMWWSLWEVLPDLTGARWVQSWDMRGGGRTDRGSFVVGQLWVRPHGSAHCYLVDQVRGRWSTAETHAEFRAVQQRIPWKFARCVLVEAKADGVGVIGLQGDEVPGITPVRPRYDKVTRARNVTPIVSAGNAHIPKVAPWRPEFDYELMTFPAAANDDQVDAMTQALDYLYQAQEIEKTEEQRAAESWAAMMGA